MVALESGFRIVDGNGVRWFGVALFIVGGVLRLWPIFTLQGRFSGLVAIQPEHKLMTTGIYSIVPQSQLSGIARQRAGLGTSFSVWNWGATRDT